MTNIKLSNSIQLTVLVVKEWTTQSQVYAYSQKHNQPVQQVEPHAIMNSHVTKLSYVLIKYGKKYLSMITEDINITVMRFLAFKLLTLPEVCWCSNKNKIYRILGTYVNIQELFGLQKVPLSGKDACEKASMKQEAFSIFYNGLVWAKTSMELNLLIPNLTGILGKHWKFLVIFLSI